MSDRPSCPSCGGPLVCLHEGGRNSGYYLACQHTVSLEHPENCPNATGTFPTPEAAWECLKHPNGVPENFPETRAECRAFIQLLVDGGHARWFDKTDYMAYGGAGPEAAVLTGMTEFRDGLEPVEVLVSSDADDPECVDMTLIFMGENMEIRLPCPSDIPQLALLLGFAGRCRSIHSLSEYFESARVIPHG